MTDLINNDNWNNVNSICLIILDKQDTELCTELFNLLAVEGLNLSQEVMEAIITSETGKSVKELVADENVLKNLSKPKNFITFKLRFS